MAILSSIGFLLDCRKHIIIKTIMPDGLFARLGSTINQTIPVAIMLVPESSNPAHKVIFQICQVTCNQMLAADAVLDAATPPPLFEKQAKPGTPGLVDSLVGYDYDHPDYIRKRDSLMPLRNAHLCLFGCPALAESTPGVNTADKANAIIANLPAPIVQFLASEIENISVLAAAGEKEVAGFFPDASTLTNTRSSPGSSGPKRQTAKKQQPKDSTARTSNTRHGKPPASGA